MKLLRNNYVTISDAGSNIILNILNLILYELIQLRYQKAVEAKQQRVGARCTDKGDSGFSGVLGAGKRQVQGIYYIKKYFIYFIFI